ncbi:sensor histidine kinase [Embleya sp. NPDC056575]|uniref:sensor histidine kinase n=1 Tax=unclassified Embleya TaxID=2699296 RepID=UPI0036A77DF8
MTIRPTAQPRRWWPHADERLRLTLLYAGLLLLAGGGLIAVMYTLLRHGLYAGITDVIIRGSMTGGEEPAPDTPEPSPRVPREGGGTLDLAGTIEQAFLNRLLTASLIALVIFAALSVLLAWWMAGRVLRPVGAITRTAQRLSATTLHQRIDLDAPPGELKQLADTFDDMLDRIEHLVDSQRRFAANAAHELRTPLAQQRAAAEIGLAGHPDHDQVAYIRRELVDISEHSQHLIAGLLLLATSERGLDRRTPCRIDEIARTVAATLAPQADRLRITLTLDAKPLWAEGDPVLLERLTHNLVSNAIRYNHPGGHVTVRIGDGALTITNTGATIAPDAVPRLFEPFHRSTQRRQAPDEGVGLGLAIVAAIARAHGAQVAADANPHGGLTVQVAFGPTGAAHGSPHDR